MVAATAAFTAVLSLVTQVLAERIFGTEGFAHWAFLNATLALLVPVACMGSNHLLLSGALSHLIEGPDGGRLLAIHFGHFTAIAIALAAVMLHYLAPAGLGGAAVASLYVLLLAHVPLMLVFPVFQRQRRLSWVAGWPLLQVTLRLVAVLAVIVVPFGVDGAFVGWAIAVSALACAAIWVLHRHLHAVASRGAVDPSRGRWERQMRVSVAGIGFGLNDLAESMDIKLFVPIAAWLLHSSSVSLAVAGFVTVLLSAIQFLPWVVVTRVLLPAIHTQNEIARQQVARLVTRMSFWAAVLLLPVAGLFYVWGFPLLDFVVSGDYRSEQTAVAWLGAAFVPLGVSQFLVAPHMADATKWRLFRWRIEGLFVFLLISLAGHSSGLVALVLGFAAGRAWLSFRAWRALPADGRAT